MKEDEARVTSWARTGAVIELQELTAKVANAFPELNVKLEIGVQALPPQVIHGGKPAPRPTATVDVQRRKKTKPGRRKAQRAAALPTIHAASNGTGKPKAAKKTGARKHSAATRKRLAAATRARWDKIHAGGGHSLADAVTH